MRLIVILGDQLSRQISSLRDADPERDQVVMAEVVAEARYVPHHPKKIAFIFSAMRHFAAELREAGYPVHYHHYDPAAEVQTLGDVLAEKLQTVAAEEVVITHSGEWRLQQQIDGWQTELGIAVSVREDDRFFSTPADFADWAGQRKQPRMEYFYRELRKRHGILMDGDNEPAGGQWNFDVDNRRAFKGEVPVPAPLQHSPDAITREVLALVAEQFGDHFGELEPFWFAVTPEQAQASFARFLDQSLAHFGDYQDAMTTGEDYLFHALIALYLNAGLLDPRDVCAQVEARYRDGAVPINAAEGFIRQILGWREYVRGIYWTYMPEYAKGNPFGNQRPLPHYYWSGDTGMNCVRQCVQATERNAYAHHIQRLMVTGNFALLAGIDPEAICQWYLAVYADAYDWVELPNTLGMVMHADGGLMGSKPYCASGKYIQRMSDYCRDCQYKVTQQTGPDSCPFNALYWHFLDREREHLSNNPRLKFPYANWRKFSDDKRRALRERGDWLLANLERL